MPRINIEKPKNKILPTGTVGRWDAQRPMLDARTEASNT